MSRSLYHIIYFDHTFIFLELSWLYFTTRVFLRPLASKECFLPNPNVLFNSIFFLYSVSYFNYLVTYALNCLLVPLFSVQFAFLESEEGVHRASLSLFLENNPTLVWLHSLFLASFVVTLSNISHVSKPSLAYHQLSQTHYASIQI